MMESSASSQPLRVALAAGGTGGHLMPALAAAEALAARTECEFLVVGSESDTEREIRGVVPYPVVEVRARPLAGRGLAGKLRTALLLPPAVMAARRHLRAFGADLVVATGGYVCGPTGLAAAMMGIPLLVLEQNAAPGLATRMLAPFARAIAVSFAETATRMGSKAVLTGNPIRATLPEATDEPGDGVAKHLLIMGGSQGSHGLNSMVELAIPQLAEADVPLTVTHQTGKHDVEQLREAWAKHGVPATVVPFINSVGEAYARADLVCARAGATTCAEIAYCGLPAILVPFPAAAGQHQHDNARALERAGAAIMIEEQMDGTPLTEAILSIVGNPERVRAMRLAAANARRPRAAAAVADLALSLVGRSSGRPEADERPTPLGNGSTPTSEVGQC